MPGLQLLRTYQRSWLPRDVVAGLVLTALLVPAGMGYAEAVALAGILAVLSGLLCVSAGDLQALVAATRP